jgi:hypothetical protein
MQAPIIETVKQRIVLRFRPEHSPGFSKSPQATFIRKIFNAGQRTRQQPVNIDIKGVERHEFHIQSKSQNRLPSITSLDESHQQTIEKLGTC